MFWEQMASISEPQVCLEARGGGAGRGSRAAVGCMVAREGRSQWGIRFGQITCRREGSLHMDRHLGRNMPETGTLVGEAEEGAQRKVSGTAGVDHTVQTSSGLKSLSVVRQRQRLWEGLAHCLLTPAHKCLPSRLILVLVLFVFLLSSKHP